MAKKKPKDYWDLIEDAFDEVDIYCGARIFLAQYRKLPPTVAHLLAAHWCQSEVSNGGFLQFFGNSTGVLAPEALHAFEAMGLVEWATLLREATMFFGTPYPRAKAARHKLLEERSGESSSSEWNPFSELDERFDAWLGPKGQRWEEAADAYAATPAA